MKDSDRNNWETRSFKDFADAFDAYACQPYSEAWQRIFESYDEGVTLKGVGYLQSSMTETKEDVSTLLGIGVGVLPREFRPMKIRPLYDYSKSEKRKFRHNIPQGTFTDQASLESESSLMKPKTIQIDPLGATLAGGDRVLGGYVDPNKQSTIYAPTASKLTDEQMKAIVARYSGASRQNTKEVSHDPKALAQDIAQAILDGPFRDALRAMIREELRAVLFLDGPKV